MSGFSPQDRPSDDQINNCMHCGLCLPTCPTYMLTGRERSSPRGRIALMKGVSEGQIPLESPVFAQEMSDCLGCLACVSACPAGVQYGELLEAARDQLWRHRAERSGRLPAWQQKLLELVLAGFDRPPLLQGLARGMWLYQKLGLGRVAERILPGRLRELHHLMPPADWEGSRQRIPVRSPAWKRVRGRVGVLLGCVMDVLFVRENLATVRVLQRQGFEVLAPQQQPCCGALHAHAGRLDWARRQALRMMETFEMESVDWIVVNSAGCGNLMKHYPTLFPENSAERRRAADFSRKVRDVQEFLAEIKLDPEIPRLSQSLTYHDACHLAHGQGVRQAPRELLKRLAGPGYRELGEADLCCGSAGTYNLTHPEPAGRLLDRKIEAIVASGASRVGVANPGCLLQIRAGLKKRGLAIEADHPVVILDEAWEKAGA